jgi:heme exporter protein CcmD
MSEYLTMGGDGAYVWSAYGITLVALLLNVWWIRRLHRRGIERARTAVSPEEPTRQATVRQL